LETFTLFAESVRKNMENNPCLSCGACCAFFRASFYWGETDALTPDGVPSHMTIKLNDFKVAMQGTEKHPPRCTALTGTIGVAVACSIYERRSSVCRNFLPAWQDTTANPRCRQARLAHGLPANPPNPGTGDTPLPRAA
jgi:Fe-S-cluster containining protein